ncbi:DUF4157 domain-containing protein [Actinomadura sp. 9N215]|uniref:eCIS core domain-containing protein n=1 Tax=Actinomadura sp. 9N215 TaxID=3375150 RepID=UPI0037B2DB2F
MSGSTLAQDTRSTQAADRRRKRKEHAAKARTPEPRDIVSGAGQPLDPGVRRELEETLGHDLGRVRLHTDRDAAALTEMLGADAVAVGQEIFFREGAYQPGLVNGQRLLAHELLHTVQNPNGLGTLRAGRDVGAVSLPQDAAEREAESAARDLVRNDEATPEAEPGQATPGWLRYATVDADRMRAEQIDPATLVDRLTNGIVRSLRGDPADLSKRTRRQLARLPDELRYTVLERLEIRLLSPEYERVLDLVDEIEADDRPEENSLDVPAIEPDPVEELEFQRETEWQTAEERREQQRKPMVAPGPEKDEPGTRGAAGSTPQNGGTPENGTTPQGGGAPRGGQQQTPGTDTGGDRGSTSSGEQHAAAPAAATAQQPASSPEARPVAQSAPSGARSEDGQQDGGTRETADSEQGAEETDQQGVPAASEEESAAKNRPGAVDSLVAGQQLKPEDKAGSAKPTGSPTTAGKDTQLSGADSTLDGVRNQDLEGPEEKADENPFGSGSESEVKVGGEEKSAWDIKLQPEDFLPEQDLDVSGVPTADKLDPSSSATPPLPSFPTPPVTKADKVQAERDAEDAEDAEEAAAAEAEPEEDVADTEPSAEAEEGEPAGGQPGDLALKEAAEASPPAPGAVSKNPASGDDPKAGPVAAQMTVQEASGKSEGGSETKEQAAKEEKGTSAGGDRSGGAPEKASQQALGGQSAASEPVAKQEQKRTDSAPAAKSEPTADSKAPSPARDTHISGGSNADTPGGASSNAAGEARREPSGGSPATNERTSRTEAPAAKESAPAAPEPTTAPEAPAAAPRAAPAAKAQRGGGGGGGGSRAAAPTKGKKDSAPAPNLSQVAPEAGLSTAAKLKPHKALAAMTGVSGSVDRTVGDEHKALAAAPPSMQRPAGAPQTLQGKPKADAPAQYSQDPAKKSEAPEEEKAEVKGAKEPEGPIEAEKAEEPGGWDSFKMALGFGLGWIANKLGFEVDAQELAAKFAGLPTKDEALKQAQAGNAPGVQMEGAAEQTAGEQGSAVDTKGQETVATGRDDAGRPMGENQVYPNAPKEQMTAKVPGPEGGKGGAPGTGAATGAVPPEAASEVAEHDRGPQFQAAFSEGQQGISEGRQTKDRDFRDSQQKHKQKVNAEVATNTKNQAGEREKALNEVTTQRSDWRKEQDGELKKLGTKKTERHEKVRKDVKDKEEKTDKDVTKEKEDGDKKIQDENTKAEQDAEKKRDDSVKESGNWISKAFDWIKQKVIEIKNAIVSVIRKARDAVVGFIKNFKETVERWINEARKFIVDTIKNLINDLIEFVKSMVRAIIELANSIRKLITSLIEAAIAFVNKLATMLKQIITDLLNAIGKLLSDILNILKKMLQDVIKAVVAAVKAVLDYASKLLNALGEFMMIAVDFLSDPGGWLSGAKNSAVDGAKNHLFREVKEAVKQWFQSKIQEIIGVPKATLDKLIKGGYTLERIVKETWEAIVPQLPFIIGEIVITKVVAKLIPGAGWVMAVIDAIRTAIGALSEIIRAVGAVISWLKAVRSGGAGILFAKAVAAGIVALLELAYEFLLSGIGKYVAKVGKRLKDVAAKLGGKGDKGGDKGPGAAGSDDKGGDKKDQEQKPKKDGTDGKPFATAPLARPTTTKPKPSTKPDPNKPATPGSGKDAAPGRPKPSGHGKPTDKDKDGKPKDKDDGKPDTRPTPSPRPKPQPKPPPKPKPEPTPKPRPDDKGPDQPKGDQESGRQKPDDREPDKPRGDDTDPDRPRDRDPNKPQDSDVPGPRKPRPDRDGDRPGPRKPRPDRDSDKPGPRRPGKPRPLKPDKDSDTPGRPKSPKAKNDRKNEEADSLRNLDLPTVRFRINNGEVHTLLFNGRTRSADLIVRSQTESMSTFFGEWSHEIARLDDSPQKTEQAHALRNASNLHLQVERTQDGMSPRTSTGASGRRRIGTSTLSRDYVRLRDRMVELAYFMAQRSVWPDEPELPPTVLPPFIDGVRARSFKASYIKNSTPRGEDSDYAKPGNPLGWSSGLYRPPDYTLKMHLLSERIGGLASGSNLVPAPLRTNNAFKDEIEDQADKAREPDGKMIWYSVQVNFHPSPNEFFPSHIVAKYGSYKKVGNAWEEKSMTDSYAESIRLPRNLKWTIRVNDPNESEQLYIEQLGATPAFVKVIKKLSKQRKFKRFGDLKARLEFHEGRGAAPPKVGRPLGNLDTVIQEIMKLDGIGRITY